MPVVSDARGMAIGMGISVVMSKNPGGGAKGFSMDLTAPPSIHGYAVPVLVRFQSGGSNWLDHRI